MWNAAYHFDAERFGGWYGPPINVAVVAAILKCVPRHRRHVRLWMGDLLIETGLRTQDDIDDRGLQLLLDGSPHVTVDAHGLQLMKTVRTYVVRVEGLDVRDAHDVDLALAESCGEKYIGYIGLRFSSGLHWVLYDQSLRCYVRLIEDEIRVLGRIGDGPETDWPEPAIEHWQSLIPGADVSAEMLGAEGTVFDPYQTHDRATRLAKVEDLASREFGSLCADAVMRAMQVEPRLLDSLHGALNSLSSATTPENLSHASLSCRRFEERLADVLFPARKEAYVSRDGTERQVSQTAYRNRLWAYVDEQAGGTGVGESASRQVREYGTRIDALDALANKGIHSEVVAAEARRLIVSLIVLTFDLLRLRTADEPNLRPYDVEFRRLFADFADGDG